MSQAALAGLRILDFSRVLAGPYCSMMLADLGADVIKIESLAGDDTRQWGPPWQDGESAYYLSTNRNKRSLALNLKDARGQQIARSLADKADVVIENFKVGGMARFGLDYAALSANHPELIYCSLTGYGQTGPKSQQTGYDFIIQAEAGVMSITGPVEGEPTKVGVAIVDVTAGLYASQAILAALHHRDQTGQGQYIDVALFDAQLGWLVNVAQNYLVSGNPPKRYGNAHANIVPYQTFQTADGYLALGVGNDKQYHDLCVAAGRADLWEDVRFQTNPGRVTHRTTLIPLLQQEFMSRKTGEWLGLCQKAGIPAGAINDVATALNDDQSLARAMVQEVTGQSSQPIRQIGPVAKLSQTPAEVRTAPPRLGEHTREILSKELSYSSHEIQELERQKVILSWPDSVA